MMATKSRNNFKWSINEVISLQREYELLNWDINTIASKHGRTPRAIMFKLHSEGFADYDELYTNYAAEPAVGIHFKETAPEPIVTVQGFIDDNKQVDNGVDESRIKRLESIIFQLVDKVDRLTNCGNKYRSMV
jgi:hypothetical protein